MLNELVPNYIYKPGTRLLVRDKRISKLLADSIINIIGCNVSYPTGIINYSADSTITIDLQNSLKEEIVYRVLVEKMGKTGKKRMEQTDIKIPLFIEDINNPLFVEEKEEPVVDLLSAKNDNDFVYWVVSKILANKFIEYIYMAKFKSVKKPIHDSIKLEKSLRYKHITYVNHILEVREEEYKIKDICDYLTIPKNKEEIILELREIEGLLAKAILYYSIRFIGRIKICIEAAIYFQKPIINTPGWGSFGSFINSILLTNRDTLISTQVSRVDSIPEDSIMKEALFYAISCIT